MAGFAHTLAFQISSSPIAPTKHMIWHSMETPAVKLEVEAVEKPAANWMGQNTKRMKMNRTTVKKVGLCLEEP